MKHCLQTAVIAATCIAASCTSNTPTEAERFGPAEIQRVSREEGRPVQQVLFDDGNYAMFIHFGLYSKLEGEWKGKTYYGNAEWIMNSNQAGIPIDEYMAEAATFNPAGFDADEIVSLAKDAGMKYIVITSKHHEGFAMFDSEACDFNIADATPFKRDVIGELADACHRNGLGIGFYYSQYQDWTAPGGGNGPSVDADGNEVSFEQYFREKCVPQVEEITTKYGEIELIWFDTPGPMGPEYSRELYDIVKKNQPNALISSRIGNNIGDYETLNDMEIPVGNIGGRWEGIDVTQVGWGYSKNDNQWKSPEYIVKTLVSIVSRGGTFMLNVGPMANGKINENAAAAIRKAGEWVRSHPQAIYRAQPSPWNHAFTWGDAVVNNGNIYLTVLNWPEDGKIWFSGMNNGIKSARLIGGRKVSFTKEGIWTCISLPGNKPDEIASVIEIVPDGEIDIDGTLYADPSAKTCFSTQFARTEACNAHKSGWMENFGEWITKFVADGFTPESVVSWTVAVKEPGTYNLELEFSGEGLVEWTADLDGEYCIKNQKLAFNAFGWHPLGWIRIDKPGEHTFSVRITNGEAAKVKLGGLSLEPVNL